MRFHVASILFFAIALSVVTQIHAQSGSATFQNVDQQSFGNLGTSSYEYVTGERLKFSGEVVFQSNQESEAPCWIEIKIYDSTESLVGYNAIQGTVPEGCGTLTLGFNCVEIANGSSDYYYATATAGFGFTPGGGECAWDCACWTRQE